jgi:hypothetical protein
MRTADRVIAHDWHFPLGIDEQRGFVEYVAEAVQRNPVLVADNVADYVDHRGTFDLTALPSLAPPWPSFWIEYPSTSGQQRRGVWVMDSTNAEHLDSHFLALRGTAEKTTTRPGDIKWTVTFVLFTEVERRKVWGPLGMSMLILDEHGAVLGHAFSTAPLLDLSEAARQIVDGQRDYHLLDLPAPLEIGDLTKLTREQGAALKAEAEVREREMRAQLSEIEERLGVLKSAQTAIYGAVAVTGGTNPDDAWLTRALAPAYQAVAFLHCKNVELNEVVPADRVQTKRRRHGKEPLVRYHTLRLDVPRRADVKSTGGGDHGTKSLHIVAGHFAHYGACCDNHPPHGRLFGRLEGVYWVPTHARGNQQVGTVRTDFDLRVPA